MRTQVFSPTYPIWALVGVDFKASRRNCTSMSGLGPPTGGAECRVCNLQAAPLHQVHTIKATRKYSADVHCCRGPQKFWIVHALDIFMVVFISIPLFPALMGVVLTQSAVCAGCWWWHSGNQRWS